MKKLIKMKDGGFTEENNSLASSISGYSSKHRNCTLKVYYTDTEFV